VSGNSEVALEMRFKNMNYKVLVNAFDVKELKQFNLESLCVRFGAMTTIASFEHQLKILVNTYKVFFSDLGV
jgi:hypothetical protein